ncbi:PTS-dependent dihydroxyacetone kinase phosphotransferase subunit DhaM [Oceanivirga miroungae]|uniref:PTS system fructose subfamily transporter subunit IIA n=1 Tax=Oceanivirga miroungae TaxID=1130046 RepID=A0A6I8MCA1_9FUSO|nr:diguanylate cyclase [Oceanivirga miroungae]VWL85059.1 PTS system fructose subfamily transporter subunit IIA [Oceanivirga miroungae]
MVSIVVITHSRALGDELIKFSEIFKTSEFSIENGTDKNLDFGTNIDYVESKIKKVDDGSGVLIFVDLGSSIDIAYKVKEKLSKEHKIEVSTSPILEGLITAVAANDEDVDLKELKKLAEDSINFRKAK